MSPVRLSLHPFHLEFRYPFRIAHGTRTGTDVVFVRAESDGYVGYGEAALPPYLEDTVASTSALFEDPYFHSIPSTMPPAVVSEEVAHRLTGHFPAKAALDMALWQLKANSVKTPLQSLLGLQADLTVPHTYTLGVGAYEEMKIKIEEAVENGFRFFKLKLDGRNDEGSVNDYCTLSDHPFAVDANQAWTHVEQAISFSRFLRTKGCVLIEQPFSRTDRVMTTELRDNTDIPIIADEACQHPEDLPGISTFFDGVNVKLQKCGGLTPALKMIQQARSLDMKILIGCMSESSVGCSVAEALAPMCDWADLDGPWLIRNDPDMRELFS